MHATNQLQERKGQEAQEHCLVRLPVAIERVSKPHGHTQALQSAEVTLSRLIELSQALIDRWLSPTSRVVSILRTLADGLETAKRRQGVSRYASIEQ